MIKIEDLQEFNKMNLSINYEFVLLNLFDSKNVNKIVREYFNEISENNRQG